MAEEIKKINVRIGGMSYQLVSSENENYTRQIAAKADEMIRRVMQNNPQLSLNMSTILALVNALDELSRASQQLDTADSQRQDIENQASEIRRELMRMREQNWEMKKEVLRLGALCREYEVLLDKATSTDTNSVTELTEPDLSDESDDAESSVPTINGLKQTNLEDYLRENSWQQPAEQKEEHDKDE